MTAQTTEASSQGGTVLVPLDFSDCSGQVLSEAIGVARKQGASLLLLHVVAPVPGVPDGAAVKDAGGELASAGELLQREAEALLAEHLEAARAAGLEAEPLIVAGNPAEAIIAAADARGASQIVMGTHGRTGLTRLLLGSVADKVTRKARQPVLTVKSQRRPECEARGCAWCPSHVTAGRAAVAAEGDG